MPKFSLDYTWRKEIKKIKKILINIEKERIENLDVKINKFY
jgi:hypothetical protein